MIQKKIIFNIGRQFGSGGKQVALCISEKLGIPVYDSELITEAAAESGFSKDLFLGSDEKRRSSKIASLFGVNRYSFGARNFINDNELFNFQSAAIRHIAENGSAIFIGRASDYVLRDMDCCLDVFISAPIDKRISRVAERMNISADEAESMIGKKDKGRESYYNFFTFGNWGVASNYDLCIDSSKLGIEGTSDFIIEFAKRRDLI